MKTIDRIWNDVLSESSSQDFGQRLIEELSKEGFDAPLESAIEAGLDPTFWHYVRDIRSFARLREFLEIYSDYPDNDS